MKIASSLLFLIYIASAASAQSDAVADAADQMRAGHLAEAEQTLDGQLRAHPNDTDALMVMAAVLDTGKQCGKADPIYAKLLKLQPHSAALFNNYGNHLLAEQKWDAAARAFAETLRFDPHRSNAILQLATLSIRAKHPAEAQRYLDRLPSGAGQGRDVAILKMQAAFGVKNDAAANALLAHLSDEAAADKTLYLPLATALAQVGRNNLAERLFAQAVEADPTDFNAMYGLGLAASHASHPDQALDALRRAAVLQPENAAVLYDEAVAELSLAHSERALSLLAQATKLAPDSAEAQLLLARTLSSNGYFADASTAWERYLQLVPGDLTAERERAFAQTAIGQNTDQAMRILEASARSASAPAVAHYDLGAALSTSDAARARSELTRALSLDGNLTSAYMLRATLEVKSGDEQAALADLQQASVLEPSNAAVLDRLGQFYASANQPDRALPLFERAAALAPDSETVLLRLARLLLKTGETEAAERHFIRVRELQRNKAPDTHPAGLVAFLSLPPEQQNQLYRQGVERTRSAHPDNVEAQVRYLEILAGKNPPPPLRPQCETVLALHPSATLLSRAVRALLAADQPDAASVQLLLHRALDEYAADPQFAELNNLASQMTSVSSLSPTAGTVHAN